MANRTLDIAQPEIWLILDGLERELTSAKDFCSGLAVLVGSEAPPSEELLAHFTSRRDRLASLIEKVREW
ncbi:hypothetical protein [Pseudoduganella violacea]|uniref:Uncharacterized protein n=1 Tax=Pseudoduganella violacea TaxID=1715466 RepID=A0A7W5BH85_9BURK|nr:hypothetical protein [Pseudoduganella violacea]MBB3122160.1 hypothetical protein [Pseudoduganella violacea]